VSALRIVSRAALTRRRRLSVKPLARLSTFLCFFLARTPLFTRVIWNIYEYGKSLFSFLTLLLWVFLSRLLRRVLLPLSFALK